MARIVTVYDWRKRAFVLTEMSYIRWFKISEALASLGHDVHIATNEPLGLWRTQRKTFQLSSCLSRVPLRNLSLENYEVVKTLFHIGFESLELLNGCNHPFIISKLGSVVGPSDMPGIPFFGKKRERLFKLQEKIYRSSKYVTVLTTPAKELWEACFPSKSNVLIVPGAVDSQIPEARDNPYPVSTYKKCIFAGNIYIRHVQPEANQILVEKLNTLGKLLFQRGIRLYMIGTGDVKKLERNFVSYLGAIPYDRSWDFLRYADVGVVLNPGTFLHNNESSKIYHYLRVGLPAVVEQGFPNDDLVLASGLGYVSKNGNMNRMADLVEEAVQRQNWDRESAIQFILKNHTWECRAAIYDRLIREYFA